MSKVFGAHAVSVDGFITGRGAGPGRGLGDGGLLFDWYFGGDTPSGVFDGFRLSAASARVFDATAGRVGAVVAGRTTYEDSERFGGGSPHPDAPLVVLSRRPVPELGERQTLATSVEAAIAAARELAGDKDVALMGGEVLTEALAAGLVDEVVLHQVPVLLGAGRPFFHALPGHVHLSLLEAVPAPGVTHLRYAVHNRRSPTMLDADLRRVLDGTAIAHIATVLPDGGPHAVPVWIGTHGEYVAVLTGPGTRKARNLHRDPRVAISLTPPENPYQPIALRGRVVEWVDGEAGWELVDRIATKYTGGPYSREDERVVALIELTR